MPVTGVFTPADWYRGVLDQSVSFDLEGRLFLTPEDLIENGDFTKFSSAGDPLHWLVDGPGEPDGWNVYVGKTPNNMTKQNSTPLPMSRSSFVVSQPLIFGDPFPQANKAGLAPPRQPYATVVPASLAGYAGGTYRLALTWVRNNLHTPLSPYVQFSIGQGNGIRAFLPTTAPAGVDGIGIWLSFTNGTDLRLQRVVPVGDATYDLTGPFRWDRSAPRFNETFIPPPPIERRRIKSASFTLQHLWLQTVITYVTAEGGETTAGTPTIWHFNGPQPGKALGIHPFHATAPPGVVGWKLYVRMGPPEGESLQWHVAHDRGIGPHQIRGFGHEATLYGYTEETSPRENWDIVTQSDPPTDNDTGIEPLDSQPDPPTLTNSTRPGPGTYWYAMTYQKGRRETSRSPVWWAYLNPSSPGANTTNEMMRLVLPHPLNHIPNAEFSDVDSSNFPFDHFVITPPGSFHFMYAGALWLHMDGTGNSPTHGTGVVPINRGIDWYVRGRLEVYDHAYGYAGAFVLQFRRNADGTFTHLHSSTTLAYLGANGEEEYSRLFGPNGEPFHPECTHIALHHAMYPPDVSAGVGTYKYLGMRIKDIAVHPFDMLPRKVVSGVPSDLVSDDFDPPSEASFPHSSFTGVGPSPTRRHTPELREVPAPDRPRRPGTILRDITFADGTIPAFLNQRRTPLDASTVLEVQALSGIDGSAYGVRMTHKDTVSSAQISLSEVYDSSNRARLAVRAKYRIRALPGTSGRAVMAIMNSSGRQMAHVFLYANGEVWVRALRPDPANTAVDKVLYQRRIYTGVVNGDILRTEIIVNGAGTNDGELEVKAARNANPWAPRQYYFGIDWTGMYAQQYLVGVYGAENQNDAFDVDVASILVTEGGEEEYRERNGDRKIINQAYWFGRPGQPVRDDAYVRGYKMAVKPGVLYTAGVFLRHARIPTSTPARPYTLVITHESGSERVLGNVGGPLTGSRDWREEVFSFTPQPGEYLVRVISRGMSEGTVISQEFACSEGPTVKRTKRRPARGTFKVYLDSEPYKNYPLLDTVGAEWRSVAATQENLDGAVALSYRSTNDYLTYHGPESNFTALRRGAILEVSGVLTGDGITTPYLSPPRLSYRLPFATLLDEHGREFPGQTIVTDLQYVDDTSPTEVREGQGQVHIAELGPPRKRLPTFQLQTFSEETARLLKETPRKPKRIEGRERTLRIRPLSPIKVKLDPKTAVYEHGIWHTYGKGEVGISEVLEEGPLA